MALTFSGQRDSILRSCPAVLGKRIAESRGKESLGGSVCSAGEGDITTVVAELAFPFNWSGCASDVFWNSPVSLPQRPKFSSFWREIRSRCPLGNRVSAMLAWVSSCVNYHLFPCSLKCWCLAQKAWVSQCWDAEKAWLRAAENSAERGVGDIPKAAFLGCGVISEVGPERLILCRSLHTVRCLQERGREKHPSDSLKPTFRTTCN